MAGATRLIGRISPKSSVLFLCDMQEKFRKTIKFYPQIIEVSKRLLQAAKLLDIPIVATEQYPKGLGPTVSELDLKLANVPIFTKTCFSMCVGDVLGHVKSLAPEAKSVILCGIETHACILQTTLDLLEKNYDVHVIVDACSSRNLTDRMFAFRRLEKAGAFLTTSESMMLLLLKDAAHPKFRQVQQLFINETPDSGLLGVKKADLIS